MVILLYIFIVLTDVLIGESESLPEITGRIGQGHGLQYANGTGAFDETFETTDAWVSQNGTVTSKIRGWLFKASHSNPIYGRRAKVEPDTLALVYWQRSQ